MSETVIEKLKRVSLFNSVAGTHPEAVEALAKIVKVRRFAQKEVIFREGDEGDQMYILSGGSVRIEKRTLDGSETYAITVLDAGSGSFFGELALLDRERRSAGATCLQDAECLVLDRADFTDLCERFPDAGLRMTRGISRILAGRLRKMNSDFVALFKAFVEEIERGG